MYVKSPKQVASGTSGRSSEAISQPKHVSISPPAADIEPSTLEAVLTSDRVTSENMERLMGECPTAMVSIAGVPVECILDTGAETSLISDKFYFEQLESKTGGMDAEGRFVTVVGANDLSIPIVGVLDVPLEVCGRSVQACLLVKQENRVCSSGRRKKYPILLGCNVLRKVTEVIPPEFRDTGWKFVKEVLGLTGLKAGNNQANTNDKSGHVVTGHSWEPMPARTIRVLECHYCGSVPPTRSVLVEPTSPHLSGLDVIEGCQDISMGKVKLALCNSKCESVLLPPFTRIAVARDVIDTQEVSVEGDGSGIHITVNEVAHQSHPECKEHEITGIASTPDYNVHMSVNRGGTPARWLHICPTSRYRPSESRPKLFDPCNSSHRKKEKCFCQG